MLPLGPDEREWRIAVLKIAGGDLSLFRPSVEHDPLKGKVFATTCAAIVKSVIGEWNPDPLRYPIETVSPGVYLSSIFDASRVTSEKALGLWLDSNNIALGSDLIKRPGWSEILPNPLRLQRTLNRWHPPSLGP